MGPHCRTASAALLPLQLAVLALAASVASADVWPYKIVDVRDYQATAPPELQPIKCLQFGYGRSDNGDKYVTVAKTQALCCDQRGKKYAILGGASFNNSAHNGWFCIDSVDQYDSRVVGMENCNYACAGETFDFDAKKWGLCGGGGGCGETPQEHSDTCGVFWSVYSCDVRATPSAPRASQRDAHTASRVTPTPRPTPRPASPAFAPIAQGVQPVGCVRDDQVGYANWASDTLKPSDAAKICCGVHGIKTYSLGGWYYWPTYGFAKPHNAVRCAPAGPRVGNENCNIPCPGGEGLCGGGHEGCGTPGSPTCGVYRSVYDCPQTK